MPCENMNNHEYSKLKLGPLDDLANICACINHNINISVFNYDYE